MAPEDGQEPDEEDDEDLVEAIFRIIESHDEGVHEREEEGIGTG